MTTSTQATSNINMEKYRLRQFVEQLIDMGEVEIHDEPVSLTGLGAIIERTEKALLFKKAGPEQAELVAKTAGSRKRSQTRGSPSPLLNQGCERLIEIALGAGIKNEDLEPECASAAFTSSISSLKLSGLTR